MDAALRPGPKVSEAMVTVLTPVPFLVGKSLPLGCLLLGRVKAGELLVQRMMPARLIDHEIRNICPEPVRD